MGGGVAALGGEWELGAGRPPPLWLSSGSPFLGEQSRGSMQHRPPCGCSGHSGQGLWARDCCAPRGWTAQNPGQGPPC